MVEETRKSITKELDVCHDCAEYGGHFCDECLEEIKKIIAATETAEWWWLNRDKKAN